MKNRIIIAVFLLLPFSNLAKAESKSDLGYWQAFFASGAPAKDSPNFLLWLELQLRFNNSARDLWQILARPALGYKLGENSSGWLGYGYTPEYALDGEHRDENRLWQQFLYSNPPSDTFLSSFRSRLEERRAAGSNQTHFRFRQSVTLGMKVSESWWLMAWDEVFLALNKTDWAAKPGLDQNRLFIGPSHDLGPKSRVEFGYLFQYMNRNIDLFNHIAAVYLFTKI